MNHNDWRIFLYGFITGLSVAITVACVVFMTTL